MCHYPVQPPEPRARRPTCKASIHSSRCCWDCSTRYHTRRQRPTVYLVRRDPFRATSGSSRVAREPWQPSVPAPTRALLPQATALARLLRIRSTGMRTSLNQAFLMALEGCPVSTNLRWLLPALVQLSVRTVVRVNQASSLPGLLADWSALPWAMSCGSSLHYCSVQVPTGTVADQLIGFMFPFRPLPLTLSTETTCPTMRWHSRDPPDSVTPVNGFAIKTATLDSHLFMSSPTLG